MTQMKDRIKTPEKELNKIEINNLSDAEFKTLIIRILKELTDDLNTIKRIPSEMKDSLMKPRIKSISIIGVLEGEKKEQEIGNLFENIMKENFPNLMKEIVMQVQEAERVPNRVDAKRPTPRHIIIKRPKVKNTERILKY